MNKNSFILAIVSPSNNAYSETFIRQHKKLSTNSFFYYGGFIPKYLEGFGSIVTKRWPQFFFYKLKNKLGFKSSFTYNEICLIKSFKKHKINLVLAEYGPTGVEILKVCQKLGLPLVVHFHGFDASETATLDKYHLGYKNIFSYASSIISVSTKMKEKLIQLGCVESKIKTIPCGPSELFFNINPAFKKQQFLAIGRFVEKKAPYLTLAAFSKVSKIHPSATLVMVGEGALLPVCQHLAKLWGISDRVFFTGKLPPEEIATLFAESIAFVQHSITASNGDSEGTPVAILEAGAAGLPVVATKHAGISDVIVDQITGFLVDEYDVNEMASKMNILLNHPDKAKQMGEENRIRILSQFSLEKHLDGIRKVFEEVV